MSDTQHSLGKLVIGDPERDAVHIAVVAVVADGPLKAGMRVGLKDGGKVGRLPQEVIGIVDPFLTESVDEGDKFWLFLLPNSITSLKHNWTHPAFPDQQPGLTDRLAAEAWLRDYAQRNYTEYDYLLQCAMSEHDICFGNEQNDLNSDAGMRQKFWDSLELVTGQKMTDDQRGTEYFRCAC